MPKTKHNKTYKSKQTKRERKITLTTISGMFALFFLLTAINAFQDSILYNKIVKSQNSAKQSTLSIKDLTIITLTSNNPSNERIAYLAAFQACDALLPNTKECPKMLVSIAKQENRSFSYNTPGADSYQSYGLFQISRFYHPEISIEQANDPYFSANWTLRRLIANGYPKQVSNPVRLHNGSITNPKTLTYLRGVLNHFNSIK